MATIGAPELLRPAARTIRSHWFVPLAAVAIAAAVFLARAAPGGAWTEPAVLALLCVAAPSGYWLCYRRGTTGKRLAIQLAGLGCAALLAASYLLPVGHRSITDALRAPRIAATIFLAALEVGVGVRLFSGAFGRQPDVDRIAAEIGLPRLLTALVVLEARFWKAVIRLVSPGRLLALRRNRLLRYDALILSRELRSAVRGPTDMVILAVVIGAVLAQLLQAGSGPLRASPALASFVGGVVGIEAHRRIAGRWSTLAERTPLAPFALARGVRVDYALGWHCLCLSALGVLVLAAGASVAAVAGYVSGVAATVGFAHAALAPARAPGGAASRPERRGPGRSTFVPIAAAALILAALATDWLLRSRTNWPPGLAALMLVALASQLRSVRLDPRQVRLLAFAGRGPLGTAAALLRVPALIGLASAAAGAALGGMAGGIVLLLLNGSLLGLASLRILLLRRHPPRRSDLLLLAGCALVAWSFGMSPPLAPFVAVGAAAILYRRSLAMTWAPA